MSTFERFQKKTIGRIFLPEHYNKKQTNKLKIVSSREEINEWLVYMKPVITAIYRGGDKPAVRRIDKKLGYDVVNLYIGTASQNDPPFRKKNIILKLLTKIKQIFRILWR